MLDVIFTRSFEKGLKNNHVLGHQISDHSTVHFSIVATRYSKPTKTVSIRSYNSITLNSFKDDLNNSKLQTSSSSSESDALVDLYSGEVSNMLYKHAPITTKPIVAPPLAAWHTESVVHLKRIERKAERT